MVIQIQRKFAGMIGVLKEPVGEKNLVLAWADMVQGHLAGRVHFENFFAPEHRRNPIRSVPERQCVLSGEASQPLLGRLPHPDLSSTNCLRNCKGMKMPIRSPS